MRALRLLLEEADFTLAELERIVVRFRGEPFSRLLHAYCGGLAVGNVCWCTRWGWGASDGLAQIAASGVKGALICPHNARS